MTCFIRALLFAAIFGYLDKAAVNIFILVYVSGVIA